MKKDTIKIDAWTSGVLFLGHFLMIYNMGDNPNNFIYDEILIIFALSAWFFLGRVIWQKFKKENDEK